MGPFSGTPELKKYSQQRLDGLSPNQNHLFLHGHQNPKKCWQASNLGESFPDGKEQRNQQFFPKHNLHHTCFLIWKANLVMKIGWGLLMQTMLVQAVWPPQCLPNVLPMTLPPSPNLPAGGLDQVQSKWFPLASKTPVYQVHCDLSLYCITKPLLWSGRHTPFSFLLLLLSSGYLPCPGFSPLIGTVSIFTSANSFTKTSTVILIIQLCIPSTPGKCSMTTCYVNTTFSPS